MSNLNFEFVEKSLAVLNSNSPSFPGENTVIVTPIPAGGPSSPSAFIAAPLNTNCVVLLKPPTRVVSSKTLIDPGINPPWFGIQNLSPGYPSTPTTIYWFPGLIGFAPVDEGPIMGSPKSGSACPKPK